MAEAQETPQQPDRSLLKPLAEKLSLLPQKNFLITLASIGIAAATTLSAACDTEMENLPEIPNIRIEDLVSRPEQYKDLKELQTVGFPKLVGKSSTQVIIPITTFIGKVPHIQWYTSTREQNSYALHANPDLRSPSVKMVENNRDFSLMFLENTLKKRPEERQIQVIGQIKQIKNDKGEMAYVLEASKIKVLPAESTPTR